MHESVFKKFENDCFYQKPLYAMKDGHFFCFVKMAMIDMKMSKIEAYLERIN